MCNWVSSVSSVDQSSPTLCDPMNHSTPGLPVHHQLPKFTQTHVHQVSDAIQPLLLIKENQISQVKEFSAFLCLGRCKILDSLKSFLCYASEQSGARILCFLLLRLLRGWLTGEWLQQLLLDGVCPASLREAIMWFLDGCSTLCWLIRQEPFFFHW